MKDICVVANFCRKFDGKVDGRFLYLAEMLAGKGCDVELVTSDFAHATKCYKEPPVPAYKSKLTYVHEPGYRQNISVRRLYSHWRWGRNVRKYLESREMPDCVYCAVPSLTAALESAKYARKHRIPFVIDMQDLWPEAFGLAIKSRFLQKMLLWPMKLLADAVYKRADRVVAVSETYKDRALSVNRKAHDGLCVYLGNDGKVFDEAKEKYRVKKPENEIWLCYIGSLGYSYDIPCVIDALRLLKDEGKLQNVIKFVVIGDGALRENFTNYAKGKDVNVDFVGRLPYDKMVGLLCSCDIAINPIKRGSAGSIINKVGDYALSGLPVINTQECPEYRSLVEQYGCGINCGVGNAKEVAEAIKILVLDQGKRDAMGKASRRLAEERFDRSKTYWHIVEMLQSME